MQVPGNGRGVEQDAGGIVAYPEQPIGQGAAYIGRKTRAQQQQAFVVGNGRAGELVAQFGVEFQDV